MENRNYIGLFVSIIILMIAIIVHECEQTKTLNEIKTELVQMRKQNMQK